MTRRGLITLGLALALSLPSAGAVSASGETASDDESVHAFRYELRALGTRAGEAVFHIGNAREVAKRSLRPVRIDARTEGLAARLLRTEAVSTTWVDAAWLPVRARWDIELDRVKRIYRTTYNGRRITGTDTRNGAVFKHNDFTLRQRGADIISIFPWVMNQDMTPGTRYAIEIFDGRRVYDLEFTVGTASELSLPVGLRQAIPLTGVVTRGNEFRRELTLWLSAEPDRTPLKLSFNYGLLGNVEAILVGQRRS